MTQTPAGNPRQGAEDSRADLYYRLTYADATGETAVRNLSGRTVQISWENGAMVSVDIDVIRPFLKSLNFRQSRKGRVWGERKKKNAADLLQQDDGEVNGLGGQA